jgi:hypothetical protein
MEEWHTSSSRTLQARRVGAWGEQEEGARGTGGVRGKGKRRYRRNGEQQV